MTSIWIAVLLVYVAVTIWAVVDAYDRTDMGCLWLMLFIATPVLSVLVYIALRTYVSRRREPSALDPREYGGPMSRFASEIEKARYIEAASHGLGTMYQPPAAAGPRGGYRHFSDSRAETLIEQGLYGEAFEHLAELYRLAREERDGRGQDTYLHYIHRLPGGPKLLAAWEQERRIAGEDDDGAPPPPPKREVPF